MPKLNCHVCGKDSGTSLVCPECRPTLSNHQRQKLKKVWHRIIVEKAGCKCEYCGHSAPWDSGELCGDHILTQGARPDLVFDVTNGRCTCLNCHNKRHSGSISPHTMKKKKKMKKPAICDEPGCPIFATGSGAKKPAKCWKHQPNSPKNDE